MKLKELISFLDSQIPLSFQEDYDNSGLQTGDPDKKIHKALLTLDITDEVLDEALKNDCDVIISHHPVIFTPIKRLSGKTEPERIIIKAVKNEIAIYSAHTNLDVMENGVSRKMAGKLNLQNIKVLSPLRNRLYKLVTFIPEDYAAKVSDAIFDAGAGVTGDYDYCGFISRGTGSFRAGESSNPFTGDKGKVHFEKEIRFETIFFSHLKGKVINALLKVHPYEEVAYDIYPLENDNIMAGLGCTGELKDAVDGDTFIKMISEIFSKKGIRHTDTKGREIRKVALCGGSGAALLNDAIASGSDAFITSDIKYHSFMDARKRILLVDIGHYESEKYSVEILHGLINKNFPKFALRFSEVNTNPINYF